MKNFFKKLAFVLAIAMVITSIAPAAKASAAAKPSFKTTGKVLYIGGDVTGKYDDTYRFKFNNAAGYKATAWESDNTKIATVGKDGVIEAVGVGTAKITATLTNKAGKSVELTAKVYVKRNADDLGFGTLKAFDNALAIGTSVKVNVYRLVGEKKVWTQTDMSTCTDYVRWTSSDETVATVSKWGKVTAVAAGEATITATSYQTQGTQKTQSKSFTVKVAAGLTSVAQKSLDTFEATFASDLSKEVTKDNLTVQSMVGTTPVTVVVKDVKFNDTDKTKATVTCYTQFAKDVEYVVTYNDVSKSFKGTDVSVDAAATVVVKTAQAFKDEATKVDVAVYNKEGVDMSATQGVADRVTIEAAETNNNDYYLDASAKTVTFFNAGKVAKVKAIFHTYKYDEKSVEIKLESEVKDILSRDKADITVGAIDAFTIFKTGETPNFDKPSTSISKSDANGVYSVAVKAKNSDGKDVKSTDDNSGFTFESAEDAVVMVVDGKLYPVKEGSTKIIVKYNKANVGAFTVTVGGDRKATDVQATLDKAQIAKGNHADTVTLTVKIKDQFQADMNQAGVLNAYNMPSSAPSFSEKALSPSNGTATYTFHGDDFTVDGDYRFKITIDKQDRYVTLTVKTANSASSSYRLSNGGKTVDTVLKSKENVNSQNFSLQLQGYANNGYMVENITGLYADKDAALAAVVNATDSAFYLEVSAPSGKTAADIAGFVEIDAANGKVVVTPIMQNGTSGALVKAPQGNYVVRAQQVTMVNGNKVVTCKDSKNFVIKDTQATITPNVKKTKAESSMTLSALLTNTDYVEVKVGSTDYTGTLLAVDPVLAGSSTYVGKATVTLDVILDNVHYDYVQEVIVNKNFYLQ